MTDKIDEHVRESDDEEYTHVSTDRVSSLLLIL